ncbi:alcohol oxidase [Vararia minispora EC-137]|uniref:Alcohol oxidase n=1 Tax=Vararia minispora EC-137 TaxID=1314806 RepID=A0ACB8QY01_9AGAM|nr:alcohol oxidase [Vararia minispora EC-137]
MVLSLQSATLFSLVLPYVFATQVHSHVHYHRRTISSPPSISSNYDFVIAGGGLAGLVLASRLSEDSNRTVLVLEAGQTGDAVADRIDTPGYTYWNSLVGTEYDWAYTTVAQAGANGRSLYWPRGRVLGGSSAMNGMYSVRPSKVEVDAWNGLVSVPGGPNTTWTWEDLLPYMQRSETYVVPDSQVADTIDAQNAASSRGTTGPLRSSYPAYMPGILKNWLPSFPSSGVDIASDPSSGATYGAFFATSAINPSNWTRSYSRSAYLDPIVNRTNLDVLVNATVSKIALDQSSTPAKATSIEFMTAEGGATRSVTVNKEVIVAGGSIGSPQILMLSGIGPKSRVEAAGVTSTIDLPGVGQHLQDHLSATLSFGTNATTAYSMYHSNNFSAAGGQTEFLSYINSATAYINLTTLMGGDAMNWANSVSSALNTSASTLVPSNDSTVVAGYKAIYQASQSLLTTSVGHVEILLSITTGPNVVGIQVALQRPFSQGQLYINSTDPYSYPVIDPQALSHSADLDLLRTGVKFIRTLTTAQPLASVLTGEMSPGTSVASDADLNNWLANSVATEYHPSGTCAMLPLDQGGVVNTELVVYGTCDFLTDVLANVRVVDASVFPIEFAAHLMAPTYGLAERASSMIRGQYNLVSSTTSSSSSSPSPSNPTPPSNSTSSASRSTTGHIPMFAAAVVVLSLSSL